jgi:hypothetical protein
MSLQGNLPNNVNCDLFPPAMTNKACGIDRELANQGLKEGIGAVWAWFRL